MDRACITDPSLCYFVDDSLKNVRAAKALGWASSVYFREEGADRPDAGGVGVDATISDLEELRTVWAHLFKDIGSDWANQGGATQLNGSLVQTV